MKKNISRVKDNISKTEFKHLINYLKADTTLRESRRDRLEKIFNLLYVTGLRVNETTQITNNKLLELLSTRKTKVIAHKQSKEKVIYITENGQKQLSKVFKELEANNNYLLTSERGNKRDPLSINSVIRDINEYLKKVFPNKYLTSHSFRQTLITELAQKNINTKVIQTLIGHKDISSTYRYIKPSEEDILSSLELIR